MDRPYRTKSRNLHRLRRGHVLAGHGPEFGGYRLEFYEGPRQEDEAAVWKAIEQSFLRVGFDRMADGLWAFLFSGPASMGASVSAENYGMPSPLAARVRAWQADLDTWEPVGEVEHEDLAYEAPDGGGLEVAKEVKPCLGEDHYVEFRPLQEIATRDGGAVELEVPRFNTDLAR